ncbi:hypothetical protein H4R33_006813, partial [Dimargaris cristalligena]
MSSTCPSPSVPPPDAPTLEPTPLPTDSCSRYSLRKRKAIALYPYTLFSWVQPDTLPVGRNKTVDLSVLADGTALPKTSTANNHCSLRNATGILSDRPPLDRSSQNSPDFSRRKRQRTTHVRPTSDGLQVRPHTVRTHKRWRQLLQTRPWEATAWRSVNRRLIPLGYRLSGLLSSSRRRPRTGTCLRLLPKAQALPKSQRTATASTQPASGTRHSQGRAQRPGRRHINNTLLFGDSDDDDPTFSPTDLSPLPSQWDGVDSSGTPVDQQWPTDHPSTDRRHRKLPQVITKRHLAGKLPASFLRLIHNSSQSDRSSGSHFNRHPRHRQSTTTVPFANPGPALPHVGRTRMQPRDHAAALRNLAAMVDSDSDLSVITLSDTEPDPFRLSEQSGFGDRRERSPSRRTRPSVVDDIFAFVLSDPETQSLSDSTNHPTTFIQPTTSGQRRRRKQRQSKLDQQVAREWKSLLNDSDSGPGSDLDPEVSYIGQGPTPRYKQLALNGKRSTKPERPRPRQTRPDQRPFRHHRGGRVQAQSRIPWADTPSDIDPGLAMPYRPRRPPVVREFEFLDSQFRNFEAPETPGVSSIHPIRRLAKQSRLPSSKPVGSGSESDGSDQPRHPNRVSNRGLTLVSSQRRAQPRTNVNHPKTPRNRPGQSRNDRLSQKSSDSWGRTKNTKAKRTNRPVPRSARPTRPPKLSAPPANKPILSFLDYCAREYGIPTNTVMPSQLSQALSSPPLPARPTRTGSHVAAGSNKGNPASDGSLRTRMPDCIRVAHRTLRKRAARGLSVIDRPWSKIIQPVPLHNPNPSQSSHEQARPVPSKRSRRNLFNPPPSTPPMCRLPDAMNHTTGTAIVENINTGLVSHDVPLSPTPSQPISPSWQLGRSHAAGDATQLCTPLFHWQTDATDFAAPILTQWINDIRSSARQSTHVSSIAPNLDSGLGISHEPWVELPPDHEEFNLNATEPYSPSAFPSDRASSPPPPPEPSLPTPIVFPDYSHWFHHDLITQLPPGIGFSGKGYAGQGRLLQIVELIQNWSQAPSVTSVADGAVPSALPPTEHRLIFDQSVPLWGTLPTWTANFKALLLQFNFRRFKLVHADGAAGPGLPTFPHGAIPADVQLLQPIGPAEVRQSLRDITVFHEFTADFIDQCLPHYSLSELEQVAQNLFNDIDYLSSDFLFVLAKRQTGNLVDEVSILKAITSQRTRITDLGNSWRATSKTPSVQLAFRGLWAYVDWLVRLRSLLQSRLAPTEGGPLAPSHSLVIQCQVRIAALVWCILIWLIRLNLSPWPYNTSEPDRAFCFNQMIATWTADLWHQILTTLNSGLLPLTYPATLVPHIWKASTRWSDVIQLVQTEWLVSNISSKSTTILATEDSDRQIPVWTIVGDVIQAPLSLANEDNGLLKRAISNGPPLEATASTEHPSTTVACTLRWLVFQMEKSWALLYSLNPWLHVDQRGLSNPPGPFPADCSAQSPLTPIDCPLLTDLIHAFSLMVERLPRPQKATGGRSAPSHLAHNSGPLTRLVATLLPDQLELVTGGNETLEEYTIYLVARCHALATQWRWSLSPSSMVGLYRLFAHRQLDDLSIEFRHAIPRFLMEFSTQQPPSTSIASMTLGPLLTIAESDTCFHVFLKLVGLTFNHWIYTFGRLSAVDPHRATRKRKEILQAVSQLSPTRVMVFPVPHFSANPPSQSISTISGVTPSSTSQFTYASLGNHFALTLLFLRILPSSIRSVWPLAQMTSYLNFKATDATSRKIFLEALFFAMLIHVQLERDVRPLVEVFYRHWQMLATEYAEYAVWDSRIPTLAPLFVPFFRADGPDESLVKPLGAPSDGGGNRAADQANFLTTTDRNRLRQYQRERLTTLQSGLYYIKRIHESLSKNPLKVNYNLTVLYQLIRDP